MVGQSCPSALPLVSPHLVQVLGAVHVADCHECPRVSHPGALVGSLVSLTSFVAFAHTSAPHSTTAMTAAAAIQSFFPDFLPAFGFGSDWV